MSQANENDAAGKLFDLGDILSVTTGRLMSPRHMEGVYGILNFMTGDSLFTHQLPRATRECAPFLLEQHPQLRQVEIGEVTADNFAETLAGLQARFGKELLVNPLPQHAHEFIDPMSELAEYVHPDKIIPVLSGGISAGSGK